MIGIQPSIRVYGLVSSRLWFPEYQMRKGQKRSELGTGNLHQEEAVALRHEGEVALQSPFDFWDRIPGFFKIHCDQSANFSGDLDFVELNLGVFLDLKKKGKFYS